MAAGAALSVLYRLISQDCTEAAFLDVIETKILTVFLLAIPLEQKWFEIAFVCNANIVYGNLKSENSQDYAQKPQRNCTFMNSASVSVELQS